MFVSVPVAHAGTFSSRHSHVSQDEDIARLSSTLLILQSVCPGAPSGNLLLQPTDRPRGPNRVDPLPLQQRGACRGSWPQFLAHTLTLTASLPRTKLFPLCASVVGSPACSPVLLLSRLVFCAP
ncbi:hypothetical protein BKA81DRAFT_348889 [Phyllosticta paracitricarpa]